MSTLSCVVPTRIQKVGFLFQTFHQGALHFGMLPYNIDNLLPTNLERILNSGTHTHGSNIFGMEQDDFQPDLELFSLRIRGITFYSRNDFSPVAFGIKPGTHINNVVVTVQPRMANSRTYPFQGRNPAPERAGSPPLQCSQCRQSWKSTIWRRPLDRCRRIFYLLSR